jgi:sialate O-acetylesterase
MRALLRLALFALALARPCGAELKLSALFGDHAVLPRETKVLVRGSSEPGAEVTVAPGWTDSVFQGRADERGRFAVAIVTPAAGGPYTLGVSAAGEERVLADVLVGDVWIASGQSNMQWPLRESAGGEEETAAAHDPRLRLFVVEPTAALEEREDCAGAWAPCEPASARDFSAVGYHFGRTLSEALAVPIGVVQASLGGTVAEAWMTAPRLRAEFPELVPDLDQMAALRQGAPGAPPPDWMNPNRPSALFNGTIAPLAAFPIRGVIWYQGESNRERYAQYRRLFPALIADWRKRFAQGDFPFYFVELAPFAYPGDTGELSLLREAQAQALLLPYTGLAPTMDAGDPADLHPRDKRTVGRRLAALALAGTYGRSVPCRGPLYRALIVEGGSARLSFEHAAGLTSGDAPPCCFTIAGEDRVFHPAEARIEGQAIVVTSAAVPEPVAVRHAWAAADVSNLKNGDGWPASSFRTDAWETVSEGR